MHFNLHEPIYQPYLDLKEILINKEFDIVTTNQDTQFSREFPEKDVADIQDDWRYHRNYVVNIVMMKCMNHRNYVMKKLINFSLH